MSKLFMDAVFRSVPMSDDSAVNLKKSVIAEDVAELVKYLKRLYSQIAHDDHAAAMRLNMSLAVLKDKRSEAARMLRDAYGIVHMDDSTSRMRKAVEGKDLKTAADVLDSLLKNSGQAEVVRLKVNEGF
jgi:hypothetical protein